jgi:hypothetical protein
MRTVEHLLVDKARGSRKAWCSSIIELRHHIAERVRFSGRVLNTAERAWRDCRLIVPPFEGQPCNNIGFAVHVFFH